MAEQKIFDALQEHQKSLKALETEIAFLEKSDYVRENQRLIEQVSKLEMQEKEAVSKLGTLEQENTKLRQTLREQLIQERAELVNRAEKRAEIFFQQGENARVNRLQQLEMNIRQRMLEMQKAINQEQSEACRVLFGQLGEFEARVRQELEAIRRPSQAAAGAFTAQEKEQLDALRQEPLTDAQVKTSTRKNNLEIFIGQNLINKIGVLLVVIGVIAASQYTLLRLPDFFKGIAIFLLGGLLLLGGELLNRRKANVVSLGITAGGVAVLYVGTAVSYFTLEILTAYPAVIVCILITAASFFLSRRYDSQTISSFALIGGYLPILAGIGNITMLYGLMAYFVLLNLLALLVGVRRRWMTSTFIGFSLNLLASVYLSLEVILKLWNTPFSTGHALLLCYLFFTFLIYTAVPVSAVYLGEKTFRVREIVLLSFNTIASSLILYGVFYAIDLDHLAGLLAIFFAVIYLLLGRWIEQQFKNDKKTSVLFYLTGLAFVVLVIPFQFGRMWLSLGWLAEGLVLLLYGILREHRLFQRVGTAICGLCVAAFLFFDLLVGIDHLFAWKYLALTLGSLLVLAALLRAKQPSSRLGLYRLAAAINFCFYLFYLSYRCIEPASLAPGYFLLRNANHWLILCTWSVISVLLAYLLTHVRLLTDSLTRGFSNVLYVVSCLGVFYCNSFDPLYERQSGVLGTIVLFLVNVAAILAMRELLVSRVLSNKANFSIYPLGLSGFGLLLLTQALIVQYHLSFTNVILSLLYMLVAVSWVIFGFFRRSSPMRRFGLVLSVFSVIKLFLIDLSALTSGFRIIAYFALGGSLIVISLAYQYFIKRFELKEVSQPHE